MKRVNRFPAIFLSAALIASQFLPVSSLAAGTVIDTSTAAAGYFTVAYQTANAKMKVGVTQGSDTVYYDYVPGTTSSYTFTDGNGDYTITLYRNVSGTSYRQVESAKVQVEMEDAMAPYLASTAEITFSQDDAVGQTAAQLCAGLTDDGAKVAAIHNYIASRYTYDHDFAARIDRGEVTNYTPDTNRLLSAQKGICYDFSALFAAMCRSQGIPCAVAKGYLSGGYHAWNMVYVDGVWNAVDMTRSIARGNTGAAGLSGCVTSLDGYYGYTW